MSILAFPSSPSLNQQYQKGEFVWRWDGVRWRALRSFSASQQTVIETALNSLISEVDQSFSQSVTNMESYVNTALEGVADALIFKGTIGAQGTIQELPLTHSVGWTYKVLDEGTYAGQTLEKGDMLMSLISREGSSNSDSDWASIQSNVDMAAIQAELGQNYVSTFIATEEILVNDWTLIDDANNPFDGLYTCNIENNNISYTSFLSFWSHPETTQEFNRIQISAETVAGIENFSLYCELEPSQNISIYYKIENNIHYEDV